MERKLKHKELAKHIVEVLNSKGDYFHKMELITVLTKQYDRRTIQLAYREIQKGLQSTQTDLTLE